MSDSDSSSDSEGSFSSSRGSLASSEDANINRTLRGPRDTTRADPFAGLTLAERLKRLEAEKEARARGDNVDMYPARKSSQKRKRGDRSGEGNRSDGADSEEEQTSARDTRDARGKRPSHKNKNAPAELPSNRPVSRWRQDPNLKQNKFRDPRFSEISGKLDADKFYEAYSFLDKYQEEDVKYMTKGLKKVKNEERKEEIRAELQKAKQEMTERRRALKLREKLREMRSEEKEKVKNGKNPFFLKRSKVKEIELEERYNELKQSGKLNSFLAKKRQKNSNKDHLRLPRQRRNVSE